MNTIATCPALPAQRIRRVRLHLPVILLFVLLLPFAPLLLLGLFIVCALYGVNPFRAAAGLFRLLVSLRGTRVEVQAGQVLIVTSLF
jgi:hypothetical protein